MDRSVELDTATLAERVARSRAQILAELRKVIVGQDAVIDEVLMALFTGGHCLITGVPGLAKTLLIKTVAQILDLTYKRIQFTPDLMPADITGTEVLDEQGGHRSLRFVKGPIFAQIILADEINRTPPKTQAALLQAMQERRVTAGGRTYPLAPPALVFLQHVRAGNVGRHQVGGELDPLELERKDPRQRAHQQRLRQARDADQQAVPPAEDRHKELVDDGLLPHDDLAQLLPHLRVSGA
jgi:hypothetical protein